MFQNRALGREETLLRYPTDQSTNLLDHVGEWYLLAPQYPDENWRITSFNLILAGPGLLKELRGIGGATGALEFGLDLYDGFGSVRNLAPVVFHATESPKEWNDGHHIGTLVDLAAGNYENGQPRAGLRGDIRQVALGTVSWQSPGLPVRYGATITAVTWQADLVRDEAGAPLDSTRVTIETGVTGAGGAITWTPATIIQGGGMLATGRLDFASPIACDHYRVKLELEYFPVGKAAHRELAAVRTSIFFLVGAWIVLDSAWWTIRSLADLIHRAEVDRELRPSGFDDNWDICVARLPVSAQLTGRRHEGTGARILQPGAGITFLEVHAVTDVWYEET